MVKTRVTALLLLALCWAQRGAAQAPPPAAAAPAPAPRACTTPSPQDVDAAKQAFRDGQSAFSEGDYQQAAELWQWAYEQDCSAHALLLNLATAQELLGRPDQAGATLRQFNERAPDSPYLEANRKRIARLERVALAPVRPRKEAPRPCPALPPLAPAPAEAAPAGGGISVPWLVAASGGHAHGGGETTGTNHAHADTEQDARPAPSVHTHADGKQHVHESDSPKPARP